jgi:cytochrome P450
MRIVLGEVIRHWNLKAASRRPERVARRNVTFSPRRGTRVIATARAAS